MRGASTIETSDSGGAGANVAILSASLAEISEASSARALIAMGAHPNHGIDHFYNYRTPLASALEIGHRDATLAMLDYLLEKNEIPLASFEIDPESHTRTNVISLFSKLITGMRGNKGRTEKYVVDYLVERELPESWKNAIGEAVAKYNGEFDIRHQHDCFEQLVDLISLATFEDPGHWQRALSSDRYMLSIARENELVPALGRIVQAAALAGVDVNSWSAPVRFDGLDYPVPLLAAAVHFGRTNLVQQCLELGANMDIRMPRRFDVTDKPYTGPTLLEYAQNEAQAGGTHQVLVAWRARQVVRSVTGKLRAASGKEAP